MWTRLLAQTEAKSILSRLSDAVGSLSTFEKSLVILGAALIAWGMVLAIVKLVGSRGRRNASDDDPPRKPRPPDFVR